MHGPTSWKPTIIKKSNERINTWLYIVYMETQRSYFIGRVVLMEKKNIILTTSFWALIHTSSDTRSRNLLVNIDQSWLK